MEHFLEGIALLRHWYIQTLKWKVLEQNLQYPRSGHVSFSISNDIAATLTTKSIGSSTQN